jgi:hypothetical protein
MKAIAFFASVSMLFCKALKTPLNKSNQISRVKSTKNETSNWDFVRFIKTAAFYDVLKPKLPFFTTKKSTRLIPKGFSLWSSDNDKIAKWGPLDDVVMGGRSKSDIDTSKQFNGDWNGYTTSAGGGGFTGIRTKPFSPALDLSKCSGIEIKLKGDGQRYKFIARCDDDWNGIAWSKSFDTIKDKVITVKFLFNDLKPTRFARVIPGNDKFKSEYTTALQLSLSKFEYDGGLNPKFNEGEFKFILEEIKTI